jgi:ABC-type nitrate/sulfonate/bicarbonate transport system substrate-binding protein
MLAVATLIAVGASHRPGAQPRFPRIIIGIGPDACFSQFVVGTKEGIFTRQGIDASTQLFPAGLATLEAVLAGNADVGSAAQYTFAAMLQRGGNFKIISQIYSSGKSQCAVATADIVKPRDLLGRTVATQFGAMGQYHADRYFERFGLDASKIRMKNVAYGQIVPAFAAGDMDAFFAFEPHCTRRGYAQGVPHSQSLWGRQRRARPCLRRGRREDMRQSRVRHRLRQVAGGDGAVDHVEP